jgi:hypothetical protein
MDDNLAKPKKSGESPSGYSGRLISIDITDSHFIDIGSYTTDTITPDGWSVKYYVKDDSTKYDDVYIEWSKGNVRGVYKGESLLQFRRYFIPQYKGENAKNLFFWHGCATDCQAVLTLNKDSAIEKDYTSVIDYNIQNGQIVYVSDYSFENEPSFQLTVADLMRDKEHSVRFKNLCMTAANKSSCVDTIIFRKDKVLLKATLTVDDYYRNKEILEEKAVPLN